MTRIRTIVVAMLLAASTFGIVRGSAPLQTGTWGSVGPIADPRSGAAALPLADGRTLISGGTVAGGTATDTVVVYDPIANSFTAAGRLIAARVGHTATLLADGRVLVSGGTIDGAISSDIELFDPASGTSVLVGTLSRPRAGHAAARLSDGTVLIVGGTSTDAVVLQSAELFNPANSSVASVPSNLNQRRTGASATTLLDGRVLVAGGRDGSNDLASAELFYPSTQSFTTVDTLLSVPRSGHTALLLPHNAGVLLAGGTANGVAVATSDLFLPAIFPDPFSWGVGQFAPTGAMTVARSRATSGPAGEGYAFASGGAAGDAEHYRFVTIKTDHDDYAPGDRAVITGTGWQPGEEVTLLFQEDPAVHDDYVLTVVADGDGNIYWDQWAPEEHDLGVRFYLTATDSRSRAQTTFTDANDFNVSPLNQTVSPGSTNNFTWTFTATNAGNPGGETIVTVPAGWTTPQTGAGAAGEVTVTGCASAVTASGMNILITQNGTAGNGSCGNGQTFTLNYLQATAPTPATSTTYTFQNNHGQDPNVTVQVPATYSINDVTANEGNAGTTTFSFTVTKSSTGLASSVQFQTADGTATGGAACGPGVDYITRPLTTLNFGAAQGSLSISVTVCGDTTSEPNETFFVNLSNPSSGTTISDGQGLGTITNDDNTAPTVTLVGNNTANEGQTIHYTYSTSDPDAGETFSLPNPATNPSCGANGTRSNPLFTASTGAGSFDCTFPDGLASSIVSVQVSDGDASDSDSITVTVNNAAPTIALSGATNVNEGSPYALTLGAITDPGTDTVTSFVIHWGDSTNETFTGVPTGTKTHTYANGPISYTITVDLIDEDGTHTAAGSKDVTVDNVVPTVSAGNDATIDEGSAFSQGGSFTDPGADTWTATVDYGDGSGSQPLSLTGKTFSLNHTYADNGIFTLTVTVNDDAGSGTDTVQVTVNNVPPTVSAGADATINEGSTFTQAGSFTDPGTADTWTATVNYGDGSGSQPLALNADKTFSLSHIYTDNGIFTVTVIVTDDDGGSGSDTVQVTVNNVPPTVDAGAHATIDEGDSFSRTGSFTDPGADTWTATVNYGDGSGSHTLTLNADKTFSLSHVYTDNGTFTVTVTVTDDDGGVGTDTVIVTVKNVPPIVNAGGDATINEGSAFASGGSFTDPGNDTWTATVNYGDGSGDQTLTLNANKTFSLSHTYADNGTYTVTVTVTDDDGGAGVDTATVTVNNVPPTIPLSGAASVNEGSSYSLSLGTVVDPGADTVTSYIIHWGDGTNQNFSGSPNGLTKTHTYADGPNNYTITVDLVDEDGTWTGTGSKSLSVFNVAPTIAVSGNASVNEGALYTLTLGTVVDPGIDIVTSYVIDWGDGTSETFSGSPNSASKTHTYADGPNSYTITIDLIDEDGTHLNAGGKTVTVNNAAPVITSISGPGAPIPINTPASITANFTDAGTSDTHTCSADWDLNPTTTSAGVVTESSGSGSCTAQYTYGVPGVYGVLITITDDDTGQAQSKFEFVVVFDPNGGFVTGGGWIMSPPGAHLDNGAATGKANFGFVSKYKKGSYTPEGQTEFQFNAGDLNFHSSAYYAGSLVVTSFKAQYKGEGTINGVPGYKFILTAYDGQLQQGGGPDRFRMKIIRISDSTLIYDNLLGASDDIDSIPMAISGGSIVIHDPGKK